MKKIKIMVMISVFIATLIIIKSQIHLVKIKDRARQPYSISMNYNNRHFTSVEDVAEYAKKETARKLSFAQRNDISNNKANCVGYAQYAASLCNKIFLSNNIDAEAKAVVGCYYFGYINLHNVVTKFVSNNQIKDFIKDHDYVQIINQSEDVIYSFDPSIYDLTYLNFHE